MMYIDERQESSAVSGQEESLLDCARRLAPLLRSTAPVVEANRSLTDEVMQSLAEGGFFRIMQAKATGGYELGLQTLIDVVIEVAKGCGSSAWIVDLMALHNWMAGLFDPDAQRELSETSRYGILPIAVSPGRAKAVDGGYLVSGRWNYVSGIDHSDWAALTAYVDHGGEGAPDVRLFLVPASDYEIEDNWRVMGLRGTGSKVVVAQDVFVPSYRGFSPSEAERSGAPGASLNTSAMFSGRITRVPVFCVAIVAIAIGLAEQAIDDFKQLAAERFDPVTRMAPSHSPATQMRVATSVARVAAARHLLYGTAAELMRRIDTGEMLTFEIRASCRMKAIEVLRICTEVVDMLMAASGSSAIFDGQPLQRAFRDMHALHTHYFLNYDAAAELFGRALFGMDPNSHVY